MKRDIRIGLLLSQSGPYRLMSHAVRAGAVAAVEAVNRDPASPVRLELVERDPRGDIDRYAPLCEEIIAAGARHVVGCVTSWSRKEVIPVLERMGGSLWYPLPYEGFETSDHVVYLHACPNQHLLPLLDWCFARHGRRGYLTGSNYIWGWEMNRIARERITEAGGAVLGERYLPIGATEVARMIEEIRVTRPDFVLNNLIGTSEYAFLAALRALGEADPAFRPDRCPVLSCNLTECELPEIAPAATEGLISAGPYFAPGEGGFGSSPEAAAHAAVRLLAALLAEPGGEARDLAALMRRPAAAAAGLDPETHHRSLPALIARARAGRFEVMEDRGTLRADPYLSRPVAPVAPRLRLVP
ncbi:transporter substrate-binding protein [Frigidibacter sp. MR17.24]|uniref:transporter substrate-binding protein n=1 Tax=Frigidibacter sp. MR17.24 TaxID=3127345 RepID=UPI003012D602